MKALKNHLQTVSLPGCGNGVKRSFSIFKTTHKSFWLATVLFVGLLTPKQGFGQLSGTYTIDPGKSASSTNYKDFHSAICDLDSGKRYDGGTANGKGVSSAVVFKVADGTYDEKNTLTSISGSSLSNTVTFTSASGDSSKVILESTFSGSKLEYILSINNTSNIIISNLSFSLNGTNYTGASPNNDAAIYLFGSVNNIKVTHCAFLNNATFGPYGIIGNQNSGGTDSNKVFTNNIFNATSFAIYLTMNGNSTTPNEKYTVVNDNVVTNGSSGFQLLYQDQCTVNNNLIWGSGAPSLGVYIYGCTNLVSITGNRLFTLHPIQVIYTRCSSSNHGLISNNAIYSVFTGIDIQYGTSYCDLYYNNIYSEYSFSNPLCISVSGATNINIRNNSMETDSATPHNCIKFDNASDISSCDYNNYYSKDSLGRIGNLKELSLSAWQSATGFDTHSITANPKYHLNNYLKTDNIALLGKGTPVSSVSTDITGANRSKTNPSIGAYEAMNAMPGLYGTYTIDPNSPASATNYKDFKSAFGDLNNGDRYDGGTANGKGVIGPVIFKIADGTYSNPNNYYLAAVPGSSATNTITFTSSSSDSSKVLFTANSWILSHVSYVTLSHLGFVTIKASVGVVLGETRNVTITHCLFQTSSGGEFGILSYDNPGSVNTIINHNNFEGSGTTIAMDFSTNISVTDNIIENAPVSSGIGNGRCTFLFLDFDTSIIVRNNTFLRSVDTAFYLVGNRGKVNVSNNRISAKVGIALQEEYYGDSIVNNTISSSRYGINATLCNIFNIISNNLYADSSGSNQKYGGCLWLGSYDSSIVILNNNIQNGKNRLGIYSASSNKFSKLDYNNYYYTDTIGYFGINYANLASLQSATGFESHGLNLDPKYNLTNSLKTGNVKLEGKGIKIAGVKFDITGNPRNAIAPTIGAYEISVSDSINVWPGDANNDGKADITDLLSVGVAYGNTGPKRSNATTNWTAQPCNDWSGTFKNGLNKKFADCNGDGTIDSNDVSPIALNFSQVHFKAPIPASGSQTDPPLLVKFSQDSVQAGDTVTAVISLGSNAINANNIYGVTLSISYGAYMLDPKKIIADFSKSWLGTVHKNMVSLVVNDSSNKIIHIGLTRTDHTNVSGAGEIGALSIYMPDNVAGKREVKQIFDLVITDYKSITANEADIPLNPISDSILVYEFKSGINTGKLNNSKLNVYPNPAYGSIHVSTGNTIITGIRITDLMGKTIIENNNIYKAELNFPVSELHSGVYFMDVTTLTGTYRTRFEKE